MIVIGCLRRVVGLVLVLLLLGVALLYRDRIVDAWHRFRGEESGPEAPSPELADRAEARIQSLGTGEDRVALSEAELQSLVEYRFRGFIPEFVLDPKVGIDGDRLRVTARIPKEHLPSLENLGAVGGFLPDTTDIGATGQLLPLDSGRVALAIDNISAAKIPMPRRLIPVLIERLGRDGGSGVPDDAIVVPLPPGAAGAYVRDDSLVLIGKPAPRGGRGR